MAQKQPRGLATPAGPDLSSVQVYVQVTGPSLSPHARLPLPLHPVYPSAHTYAFSLDRAPVTWKAGLA